MTGVDSIKGRREAGSSTDFFVNQSRFFRSEAARQLQKGNLMQAGDWLKKAMAVDPSHPQLWDALGNATDVSRDPALALLAYQRALIIDPFNAASLSDYGRALIATEQYAYAETICREALTLNPSRLEAYFNRAIALKLSGALDLALDCYQRTILILPRLAQAHCNMAEIYALINQFDLAEAHYHRALEIDCGLLMAWVNLGNIYLQSRKMKDARRAIEQAMRLKPELPAALSSFGSLLKAEKSFAQAATFYHRALHVYPTYVETLNNLGNTLREQELWDDASAAYKRALSLNPSFAAALYNWGIALYRQGQIAAVETAYERARSLMPDFPEVHLNLGFLRLSQGDYPAGFALYEWRFKQPDFFLKRRTYDFAEWDGNRDLRDARVLVYAEQGLGDTIQFFRFIKILTEQGAYVTLEVQPELVTFLEGYHSGARIVAMNQAGQDFDLHLPLMSLPLALGTQVESIPPSFKGYHYSKTLISRWVKRLGPRLKSRIGIVFSGNPNHINDHLRSVPWEAIEPLLGLQIEFICLQKEIRPQDAAFIQRQSNIRSFQGEICNFEDTAVLCSRMDLVISVDTSVAHLAASLEIPTWILLTEMPDWRWLLATDKSPWYPSARLLRKKNGTSWSDLMKTVGQDLLNMQDSGLLPSLM